MFASVGPRGPPAEELQAFRGLCERGCGGPHDDGWGIVGYASPKAPRFLGRSIEAAERDAAYEAATAQAQDCGVVVAHLRKASVGGRILDNTHPFTLGPWTFAHNGTIEGGYVERFAPGQDVNDSRVLFSRVHQHLDRDPLHALGAAFAEVRERGFPYTSMTVLLTDGQALWAAREVYEDHDYYQLHWQRRGDRVVLCQEPILSGAWAEVPDGHCAVVRSGSVQVVPLPVPAHPR
jgi:predicted glutamine amidotransferase